MDSGRVVETGTHADLHARGGALRAPGRRVAGSVQPVARSSTLPAGYRTEQARRNSSRFDHRQGDQRIQGPEPGPSLASDEGHRLQPQNAELDYRRLTACHGPHRTTSCPGWSRRRSTSLARAAIARTKTPTSRSLRCARTSTSSTSGATSTACRSPGRAAAAPRDRGHREDGGGHGHKPIINTNGLAMTEGLLHKLKDAGLVGSTFHVRPPRGLPGWKKKNELRRQRAAPRDAQLVARVGGLSCAFKRYCVRGHAAIRTHIDIRN